MPDIHASIGETERALDELRADGIVLAPSARGVYLGAAEHDPLFRALDDRHAVVFVHPGELPGQTVDGITRFAADFLLDTTRAAYLLVRNGIVRRYPDIRFILSHAGGFVPYASRRLAVAITAETGRTPLDVLEDLQSFYFDTALSSSPAALPSLLAFARPGHVLFGSDWPFAPTQAVHTLRTAWSSMSSTRPPAAESNTTTHTACSPASQPNRSHRSERRRSGSLPAARFQRSVARTAFKLVQPS